MKSRRRNLEGKRLFEHHHCAEGTSAQEPEPIGNPSAPLSLVSHWNNISTPSVVAQTSGRLKGKYIPIDISAYQQNRGFSPFAPTPPQSASTKLPTRPLCAVQGDQAGFLPLVACDFPESVNEGASSPSTSESLEFPGYSEHSQIQHYVPDITPIFGQPSPQYPRIGHSTPDLSQPASLFPRLRHEKRLLPPPPVIPKVNLHLQAGIKLGETRFVGYPTINMNQSTTSLSALDQSQDDVQSAPKSTIAQVGIPSSTSPQVTGSGPTNLSGLVCNVHRTTGQEPHPLVGATTTILGDKLYVFGGRVLSRSRPQLTSDLYELDLVKRHWSKLETTGDVPPPRYFHSVCALGDTKLVCYGGMTPSPLAANQAPGTSTGQPPHPESQPEVVVASDIHIYDVPTQTWSLIPTGSDAPQGRYAHCATVLPSSAIFTSANAPLSAIVHNPSSSNPHSGTLGVKIDGTGGAEMVVVGGQDSSNHYIEQISVFNLRSLKWTATNTLSRSCGAYRSVVAPLVGMPVNEIGGAGGLEIDEQPGITPPVAGSSMLIYSNYNFLDVKLELQVRLPDGRLIERPMSSNISPPGLRFPNGGVINNHFVVSGTYLTSSKQEYALWALDLRNLSWGRIDAGGTVFGQGSWNRGVLWNRRNTFVILGHRKRSLVDDYNHRRINFSHLCMVELEAFGLYENPRKASPTSNYVSVSAPPMPTSMQADLEDRTSGGRPFSAAAEQLGQALLGIQEFADMDLIGLDGERVPVNSHLLSRRWGPYFNHLLLQSAASQDNWSLSDAVTLRPQMNSQASRNSSITITPSVGSVGKSSMATLTSNLSANNGITAASTQSATRQALNSLEAIDSGLALPASRPRTLYLPHTSQTIRLLVHYLYTSSLPPISSQLCTPQILCSLLQVARPYQINGLLEATVERLHEVLDGRNAAAVFNASAMAAGGGRGLGQPVDGTLAYLQRRESEAQGASDGNADGGMVGRTLNGKNSGLRINTSLGNRTVATNGRQQHGHEKADSLDSASTATSTSTATSFSQTDSEATGQANNGEHDAGKQRDDRQMWMGDTSSVIGLQKRGLRGLMEGRRLRERGNTLPSGEPNAGLVGRPPVAGTTTT